MPISVPCACGTRYFCFCCFAAPREQRQAVERDVHRQDDAQRRVGVLQLFARDAEADVVHAGAAILRGHADAEQPELGHLRQQAAIERVLAIELLDAWRHFPRRPLARRLLDEPMLFAKIEIHSAKMLARVFVTCLHRRDAKTQRILLEEDLCVSASLR